jgi:hypothetical protein
MDGELVLGGRYRVVGQVDCGTLADIRLARDALLQRKVTVRRRPRREATRATTRGAATVRR